MGWRGRQWNITATAQQGTRDNVLMSGMTQFTIPSFGRIPFRNISFYHIAVGYRISFQVSVQPFSRTYSGMRVVSKAFNVHLRQFYLKVITQPGNANQSMTFGKQPVIDVQDIGTHLRATPLKGAWWIAAFLSTNPKPGQSQLMGTHNVSVINERARFKDLSITLYATGYKLMFVSSHGQSTLSSPFEVFYTN